MAAPGFVLLPADSSAARRIPPRSDSADDGAWAWLAMASGRIDPPTRPAGGRSAGGSRAGSGEQQIHYTSSIPSVAPGDLLCANRGASSVQRNLNKSRRFFWY
jgi:hypothetical protein